MSSESPEDLAERCCMCGLHFAFHVRGDFIACLKAACRFMAAAHLETPGNISTGTNLPEAPVEAEQGKTPPPSEPLEPADRYTEGCLYWVSCVRA